MGDQFEAIGFGYRSAGADEYRRAAAASGWRPSPATLASMCVSTPHERCAITVRTRAERHDGWTSSPYFETADHGADSACAIGLVRIEHGRIVATTHRLIRPPRWRFVFTYIHDIRWRDVAHEPAFGELWADLVPLFSGVDYLVAHHAPFDRGVLRACCGAAGVPMPATPFACAVKLARAAWNVRPTKLPDVCRHLGLDLRHHDPASDALACARIAVAAVAAGCPITAGLLRDCRPLPGAHGGVLSSGHAMRRPRGRSEHG